METTTEIPKHLNDRLHHHVGSMERFEHLRGYVYTPGIKELIHTYGCEWLVDSIFYLNNKYPIWVDLQVWKVLRNLKGELFLRLEDGDKKEIFSIDLQECELPGDSLEVWMQNETLFLPSEY